MTGRKWPEFNCGGKLWQVSEFSRIDRSSLLRGGKGGEGEGAERLDGCAATSFVITPSR